MPPEYGLNPIRPAFVPPDLPARPGPPPSPPLELGPPDAAALLAALRRRWAAAVALGLASSASAGLLAYLVVPPPKYKAVALMQVATQAPRVVIETNEPRVDFRTYQRTQEAYIRSRLVLNAALGKDEVKGLALVRKQADPLDWLEKEIQVDAPLGSEMLRVALTGDDPPALSTVVNAVTRAYLDEVVDAEAKERRDRQTLIKATWARYQESLKEKRKELKRLAELAGTNDRQALAVVHNAEQGRLSRSEDELARLRSELRSLRVEAAVSAREKRIAEEPPPRSAVEAGLDADPSVRALAERLARAKTAFERAARVARNGSDASMNHLRAEFVEAKNALAARRSSLAAGVADQLGGEKGAAVRAKLEMTEERIRILSDLEATVAADVTRLAERAKVITRSSVDLASVQEEIAAAEDVAKKLGAEAEALNVELQARARVRLLQMADPPKATDRGRVFKAAGGAALGAFVLSLAGVAFWEFRSRRVESVGEVSAKLGMRVVGTMPAVPNRRARRAAGVEARWKGLLVESIDAARAALLHASRAGAIQVVMVASASGGEGKSSLSCHLAASLARSGRKTLLVDSDLRRPSVHWMFDLPQSPGLAESLRGEDDPLACASMVDPGLWVLPAGRGDAEAVRALGRDGARALFERLRGEFDFIVVDSAPVLPVADALLVGQNVDAVLFSIMREVSQVPKVYAASERLASLGIPLIGAVVNGARPEGHYGDYAYAAWPSDGPARPA